MTDIVTPNGQTVLNGHDDHDHSNAALWALSGDHRTSNQVSFEGRFDAQASLTTMLALKDSESRTQERFGDIKALILSEGDKTRHCIMSEKLADERFARLRLEVLAK